MLKRLILREYVPLAGSLVFWLVVAHAGGREGLAVTLAALLITSAAYAAGFANLRKPAVRQLAIDGDISALLRRALPYELASLTIEGLVVAGTVVVLYHAGYPQGVGPTLLAALGLPARHRGVLTAIARHRGRNTDLSTTVRSAASGAFGLAAWVLGAPMWAYAVILALREWLSLLSVVVMVARPAVPSFAHPFKEGSFDCFSVAMATRRLGTRRLAYRALKPMLSLFGPIGAGALRTARGTGFLNRYWIRKSRVHLISTIAAIAALGASATVFLFGPTAAHLVIGCALFSFACIGGNLAVWSWIVRELPDLQEDDEPDEDKD